MHAFDITNVSVANSLMAKLDAAQAAFDRGQTDVAINLLNAFINEVNAQSGKSLYQLADHAPHLGDSTCAGHLLKRLRSLRRRPIQRNICCGSRAYVGRLRRHSWPAAA